MPDPGEDDRLERASQSTERFLIIFLASAAVAVLLLGVFLMFTVGGGRSHLPGRIAVAVASILMLSLIDGHATKLANRRRPLLAPDPPWFRRFGTTSSIAFFGAAALLMGVAIFLP
jgi:hypothetical protein